MNAALVKIDVAAAALGWSAYKLFDLMDGGTLLEKGFAWVFNLANDPAGERRDPRFWWQEIEARDSVDHSKHDKFSYYEIDWVINKILPIKRQNFHAGEVDQLFQIRRRTRIDLHGELAGQLDGGRNFYKRAALAAFLKARWLGAVSERTIKPGDHRQAANGLAGAVSARVTHPLIAAPAPLATPGNGANVRITPQRDCPDNRAALNFHPTDPEARDNGRGSSGVIPQSPKKALPQSLNKVASPGGKQSRPKSAGHIPASPATTMQRRKSAIITPPSSLNGAGTFTKETKPC